MAGAYALARLLLVVALIALILAGGKLIGRDVDVFVAAAFSVLISMPLSYAIFGRLRKKVNSRITAFEADRPRKAPDVIRGGEERASDDR
ncbi:DUF4229 domain-containing protein [Rhodococcus hoagii]|nr:DUF4229 domain-containing protein [Prescottella equi]